MSRWIGGDTKPNGNDRFTKVLLHFDGNLNDVAAGAANAHSWSSVNGGEIDSSTKKFGSGAGTYPNLATNPANCHTCANDTDFDLGSNDFTIDFWYYMTGSSATAAAPICGKRDTTNIVWMISAGQDSSISALIKINSAFVGASGTVPSGVTGTFHHVAVVRSGNNLLLFLDGILLDTEAVSGAVNDNTTNLSVGRAGSLASGNGFNGNVDEFRLSVGIARWTSNFTPPTRAYSRFIGAPS